MIGSFPVTLPYASTREREVVRAFRPICRTEAQLRSLSKYARQQTWEQIEDRWMRAHSVIDAYEESFSSGGKSLHYSL